MLPKSITLLSALLLLFVIPARGQSCLNKPLDTDLETSEIGYSEAKLSVKGLPCDTHHFRFRELGTTTWQYHLSYVSLKLNTLNPGTTYEWQVQGILGDIYTYYSSSPFSNSNIFTTLVCNPPIGSNIQVDIPATNYDPIRFFYHTNVNAFEYRYKTSTAADYTLTGVLSTEEYFLTDWKYGTTYQVSFRIQCERNGSSGWSDWSDDKIFTTQGSSSCDAPLASQLSSQVTGYNSALLTTSLAPFNYQFAYREKGTASWTNSTITANSIYVASSLNAGTEYEWRVRIQCITVWSAYSPIATFKLPACSALSASELAVTNRAEESLTTAINSVVSGEAYQWRIRQPGITSWEELPATTATTQLFNGLKAGKTYELACRIYCDAGNAIFSDWSDPITTTTLAGCPMPTIQDFEVVQEGYTKALIRSKIQADAYMFQYTRAAFPGGYIPTDELSDPSLELVRLAMDDEYLLQMRVKCGNQWSPWSRDLQFHTKGCSELFPSNLSASAPASGALQFNVNQNGNYSSYEWKYHQPVVQPVETTVETRKPMLMLTGLASGSSYFWSVRASCPEVLDEIPWTDWVSGPSEVTVCDPARPSDLYAEQVTQTSARLNCSLPFTSVYEYQYRKAGSTTWLDAPSSPVTFTDISGLTPGTEYEFRCYFDCIDSHSDWSGVQTFRTLKPEEPCVAPTVQELRADHITTDMARISCLIQADAYTFRYKRSTYPTWTTQNSISTASEVLTNLIEDETYEVQCQLTCGNMQSTWSLSYYFRTEAGPCAEPLLSDLQILALKDSAAQVQCHFPADGYQYRIRQSTDFIWKYFTGDEEGIGQTGGLMENSEYALQCRVSCTGGFSAWSPELKFRTLESILGPDEEDPPVLVDPCITPDTSQIQIVQVGPDFATVHTTYFSSKGFQFRFRRMEDNNWNNRPASKSPDLTATPLNPGTTYYVAMRAGCIQGATEWSEAMAFTTTDACSAPTAEDVEVMTDGTNAKINCTLGGVNEYQYRFRIQNDSSWIRMNAQEASSIDLKNLPADTSIVLQVRVSCGGAISEWSESVAFTTGGTSSLLLIDDQEWLVYPNPARREVQIKLYGMSGEVDLAWFSLDGRLQGQEKHIGDSAITVRTPSLPGMYLLRIIHQNRTGIRRILIQ